jgi:hypothetical protein
VRGDTRTDRCDGPDVKRIAALVLVAQTLGGCAALTVEGPGGWTPKSERAPVCDDEARGPIGVDGFMAFASAIAAVGGIAYATEPDEGDSSTPGLALAGVGVAATVGFIYSAIVGRQRVRECRAALLDWGAAQ